MHQKPGKSALRRVRHTIPHALDAALRMIANYGVVVIENPETRERVEHCKVCGEWDDHTPKCPVPAVKAFYATA